MKKECCKIERNLSKVTLDKDRYYLVCCVCRCKHHHVRVDPGKIGMQITPLGNNASKILEH